MSYEDDDEGPEIDTNPILDVVDEILEHGIGGEQLYIHILSGYRMTILKQTEHVALCELIDEPDEWIKRLQVSRKRRAVCNVKYLKPI